MSPAELLVRDPAGVPPNEHIRPGAAPIQVRVAAARGARLLCEREHAAAVALGLTAAGVACCPHCALYPPQIPTPGGS